MNTISRIFPSSLGRLALIGVKWTRAVAWVLLATFITQVLGCAYLFHGKSDEIRVQSADPKAELYLNDQPIGIGSAGATVERDKTYTNQVWREKASANPVVTAEGLGPGP